MEELGGQLEVMRYTQSSGIRGSDAGMVVNTGNSKPVKDKMGSQSKGGNLSGALSAAGGMVGTMAAGMISSKVTDTNDTTESTIGMVSTMAPMIGSMFGPWGLLIGGAVSALGLAINHFNKTDEELLQEAQ
jgi:hypothetical protein